MQRCCLSLLLVIISLTAARAESPDLEVAVLHQSGADAASLIGQRGDAVEVTATGSESYFGADDGTFAYVTTDALSWTFTAHVKGKPEGTKNAKYGIAVRTGTERWNRGLLLRHDAYEGNAAVQWLFRYGVSHGTHHGFRRVMHSGVEPTMKRDEDFWLRIERDYPTFTMSYSEDGKQWRPVSASYQFNLLPTRVNVGLMVTAGGDGKTPVTAAFDQVAFDETVAEAKRDMMPDLFSDYDPPMEPWEITLAQISGEGEGRKKSEPATFFVIKPKEMKWSDVRGFFYTTSSKETVIQNDDGTLGKLDFESGEGKLRRPKGMTSWEGTYELRPDPLYRIFEHYGLVRLGTAAPPGQVQAGIEALAKETGYPGLVNLPWVSQGMSFAGGHTAQAARLYPERTIAASPTHIGLAGWDSDDPRVLKTPHLYVVGTHDTVHLKNALEEDAAARQKGALWGVAPLWWYYHSIGHTVSVSMPFFLDVMDLRLPEKFNAADGPVTLRDIKEEDGWLALNDTIATNFPQVVKWSEASEVQRRGDSWWLPTQRVARVWQASSSDWPRTVIQFPRFDATDGWSGPPPAGTLQHQMMADEPFHILASGPVGESVKVEYYADLDPLKVLQTLRAPYLVQVEGMSAGVHNLYAITTWTDVEGKEQREISRPQMIFFHER